MEREGAQEGGSSPAIEGVQIEQLKLCDLCGALNLVQNRECFVCGWRGHFETNRMQIERVLQEVYKRHHVISLRLFTDEHTYRRLYGRPSLWQRVKRWWRKVWGR